MGARGAAQVTASLGGCPRASSLSRGHGVGQGWLVTGRSRGLHTSVLPKDMCSAHQGRLPRQAASSGQRRAGGEGGAGCQQRVLGSGAGRRPAELNMQLLSSRGTGAVCAGATEGGKQTGQRPLLQLNVHLLMAVDIGKGLPHPTPPPGYNSHIITKLTL